MPDKTKKKRRRKEFPYRKVRKDKLSNKKTKGLRNQVSVVESSKV